MRSRLLACWPFYVVGGVLGFAASEAWGWWGLAISGPVSFWLGWLGAQGEIRQREVVRLEQRIHELEHARVKVAVQGRLMVDVTVWELEMVQKWAPDQTFELDPAVWLGPA